MASLRFTQSMSCWILPALGTGQPLVAQISTLLAGQPMCDVPLIWFDKTVNATSVLDYSVLREWIDCFFIAVSCFSFFYLLPQSFFCREMCQKDSSPSHAAGQCLWRISAPSWNASAQLVKLCTPQCAWLKRLAFAEVGKLNYSWHKNTYCCRATVVCLDA